MSEFKLKRITPTFQMVINSQLNKIMEALNNGNVWYAFDCIKTLVDSLRPEDREKLREKYIDPTEKLLSSSTGSRNVDFYSRMLATHKVRDGLLFRRIRIIHRALCSTLHTGGYLEHRDRDVPRNVPPGEEPKF